jgi:hypothetical protein
MSKTLDLFGDRVPAHWGVRGRPQHIPTQENRNRVNALLACGWSNKRIAQTLRCDLKTLRKHYFPELKFREVARDRLMAMMIMKVLEQVKDGNIAAVKELRKMLEQNDLMLYGQNAPPEKEPKLGKKEAAALAAQNPDAGTPLGELMAQRQQGDRRPN